MSFNGLKLNQQKSEQTRRYDGHILDEKTRGNIFWKEKNIHFLKISFLPFLSTVVAQLVAELRLVGPVRVGELDGQVHHLRFDLVVEGIVAKSFLSLRIHLIQITLFFTISIFHVR